jgi:hypothetical protein
MVELMAYHQKWSQMVAGDAATCRITQPLARKKVTVMSCWRECATCVFDREAASYSIPPHARSRITA